MNGPKGKERKESNNLRLSCNTPLQKFYLVVMQCNGGALGKFVKYYIIGIHYLQQPTSIDISKRIIEKKVINLSLHPASASL